MIEEFKTIVEIDDLIEQASNLSSDDQYRKLIRLIRMLLDKTIKDVEQVSFECKLRLARVEFLEERWDDAIEQCNRLLVLDSDSYEARFMRARCFIRTKQWTRALQDFERLAKLSLDPERGSQVHRYLGMCHAEHLYHPKAIEHYRKAVTLNPKFLQAHLGLASALKNFDLPDQAYQHYQKAFQLDASSSRAIHGLATLHQGRRSPQELLAIVDRRLKKKNSRHHKHLLLFAKARLLRSLEEYDLAFTVVGEANREIFDSYRFRIKDLEKKTRRLTDTFDEDFCNNHNLVGSECSLPLYIVGLPRCGKSTLEKVLNGHPAIALGGEFPISCDYFEYNKSPTWYSEKAYPEAIRHVKQKTLTKLQEAVTDRFLRYQKNDETYVCNTLPGNYHHVGLIFMTHPRAKVIWMQRHPLDNLVECLFSYFGSGHSYAFDCQAFMAKWREHCRLMQHWQKIFPERILGLSLENLVQKTDATVRRAFEFLELTESTSDESYAGIRKINLSVHRPFRSHLTEAIEFLERSDQTVCS